MVLLQLADGGDGSHIWRVTGINIRGQPRRGGPPGCLFGRGTNNSSPQKKNRMLRNVTQVAGLEHTSWNDPSSRKWTRGLELGM